MELKSIKQEEGYCGPASLKITFDALGIVKTQEQLAQLAGATHESGVQNPGMVRAIERLGYKAEVKVLLNFADLQRIYDSGKIIILIWWSPYFACGHYSPVVEIGKDKIKVAETQNGNFRTFSFEEFEPLWFDFSKEFNRRPEDVEIRSAIVIEAK